MIRRVRTQQESGAILVNVLIMLFFTGMLGYAATSMIRQGSQTTTSSLRYLEAEWATDYGLNKAIEAVVTASACDTTSGEIEIENSQAIYRYQAELSTDERFCFIRAEGRLSMGAGDAASSVVKTVTLPIISDPATGGSAMTANAVKAGFSDSVNSSHTLIESACAGLTYESCEDDWCNDPDNPDYQKAMQVISGEPKLRESEFTLGGMFIDPDDPDAELTPEDILNTMRQTVLDKADELDDACTFTPEDPAGTTCSTTGTGGLSGRRIVCSGPTTVLGVVTVTTLKTINPNTCSSGVAIHSNVVNFTHSLRISVNEEDDSSRPMIFAHAETDMNLTNHVTGLLSSSGNLDISLNGNKKLDGIFIGASTEELNISGTDVIRGLFSIVSESDMEFQLNGGGNTPAVIEGAVFTNATMGINRNGHARISYNPDNINKWRGLLPMLREAGCGAQSIISASTVSDMQYRLY